MGLCSDKIVAPTGFEVLLSLCAEGSALVGQLHMS